MDVVQVAGPLPYLISLPKSSPTGNHPVLCFLHGYDEGPPTDIEVALTRHGPLRPANGVVALESFIIVAPQMSERGDIWHRHAESVIEIVRRVHKQHYGDPIKTYLTGFSFGANGVFDLALARPNMWSALWAVDPTRVPDQNLHRPIWLSFGDRARPRKEAFCDTLSLSPVEQQPGADAVFEDRNADHVGTALLAYRDARIYKWLLSKTLPSP